MRNFLLALALLASPLYAQTNLGTINSHTAWGDPNASNKLISWLNPLTQNSLNIYITSVLGYIKNFPTIAGSGCSGSFAGCPYYYAYYGNASNAYQMQPADTAAGFLQMGLLWKSYQYGDSSILTLAWNWVNFIHANGLSSGGNYNGIPFAASHPNTLPYDGWEPTSGTNTGTNRLEPDKAANLAYWEVKDHESNGTSGLANGLTDALAVADFLHSIINGSPSTTVSPWPMRITNTSCSPLPSCAVLDAYNSDVTPGLRLDQEILANPTYGNSTQRSHYTADVAAAQAWLVDKTGCGGSGCGPIATDNFNCAYYEDIAVDCTNYINTPPFNICDYLIDFPSVDASWSTDCTNIVTYITTHSFSSCSCALGGSDLGSSLTMAEQNNAYYYITADATAHRALTAAKLGSATSSATLADQALRSFYWDTYMLVATTGGSAGQCVIGPAQTIFYMRVCITDVVPEMLQFYTLYPQYSLPPGGVTF